MVMQPTYGNSVIDNQTIEISHEGLRSVLNEIESELINSEVYRRTMAGLQTMLGEASSTAQILVKAVGREAVRLTFQQFAKEYKIVPVSADNTAQSTQRDFDTPEQTHENLIMEEFYSQTTSSEQTAQPLKLKNRDTGESQTSKKVKKVDISIQKLALEREEMLRQVGQNLLQARLTQALSIEQLHSQTLVPPRQILALESGNVDQLPEDVYVRGFIRRMAKALGLNGETLVASIPQPDLSKSVVPSWYNSITVPEFQLNPIHLYIGYTALIAGAVGGLSLMSKQATSPGGVSVTPEPAGSAQSSKFNKTEDTHKTNKPGLQSSKTGVKAGVDIAPPEAIPF